MRTCSMRAPFTEPMNSWELIHIKREEKKDTVSQFGLPGRERYFLWAILTSGTASACP